jgi:Flp pilus assembly protein TadB
MFFVPAWLTNVLFLATAILSGFQHVQMARPNPVTNIQFFMCAFALLMMLVVVFCNQLDPWLSLGFFVIAVCGLGVMIRQNRMLPPMKPFE